jgi:hypothetical protein
MGRITMTACPQCRSSDLVGFTLAPTGQPLRFSHCRGCEHRWWTDLEEGTAIHLPDVLTHIGVPRG